MHNVGRRYSPTRHSTIQGVILQAEALCPERKRQVPPYSHALIAVAVAVAIAIAIISFHLGPFRS
jgi:hypothetical protein